ncbi:pentapeptide repeat-containing protein [Kribbella sp. NPDC049174]|uniref:pentapeptide repeat-containing protein n=1 Tax=Kribbella sp. NPDC049174 TaxID=3364112 RepID=UPI003718B7B6
MPRDGVRRSIRRARRDRDLARTPELGPLVLHGLGAVLLAIGGAVGLYLFLAWLLGVSPHLSGTGSGRPALPIADQQKLLADLVKVALGLAAGIGAAFALVVGYRRARTEEAGSHRDDRRLFSSRYQDAAQLIGSEKAAVRLAGIYAMARLADDWVEQRQQCIDVLCAYLRLPYEPDTGDLGEPEVRYSVIGLIGSHLQPTAWPSWREHHFDFNGAVFDGGDFRGAVFAGNVDFSGARFTRGTVDFSKAEFTGAVDFSKAEFTGAVVNFRLAKFAARMVNIRDAQFAAGMVTFSWSEFASDRVSFTGSVFAGGTVDFTRARFERGRVDLDAKFKGSVVLFYEASFSGSRVDLRGAEFAEGDFDFGVAKFWDGFLDFGRATFTGSNVSFSGASFGAAHVTFYGATFDGGVVDLTDAVIAYQVFNGPSRKSEGVPGKAPVGLPASSTPHVLLPDWLTSSP